MELLTQNLPSGYPYPFPSIRVVPMTFAQILEYSENLPSSEVERYYFDYVVVKADDERVDQLLLPDLEYVIFFKKGLTIARNVTFDSTVTCPECGNDVKVHFSLGQVKFNHLDPEMSKVFNLEVGGSLHPVKIPTVAEFMNIFAKYRRFKKVSDMKMIKLIALFMGAPQYLNRYEDLVVKATYEDITVLTMAYQLCYEIVEPLTVYCPECNKGVSTDQQRGVVVEIQSLTTRFFRVIIENNRLTSSKIIFGEIQ